MIDFDCVIGEVEHTLAEKSILTRIEHPFLMKMHWSFQTPDKLYLVMDFVNGLFNPSPNTFNSQFHCRRRIVLPFAAREEVL